MTLFEFLQVFVFILITLTVITGSLSVLLFIDGLIEIITNRIKNKEIFNKQYQVGSIFQTRLKQKFPHGKWKLQGQDQNGFYIYERIK